MGKKFRFIIAIIGIGVASFSSLDITAQMGKPEDGGCSGSTGKCGETESGQLIVGVYNT